MNSIENMFQLSDVLEASTEFLAVLHQLNKVHHGVYVSNGALLSAFVPNELLQCPMLVIRSERITDDWCDQAGDPVLALDGSDDNFGSSPYLVWGNGQLSIATTTLSVSDALYDGQGFGKILVAWVTPDSLVIRSFELHEDFMDEWYQVSNVNTHRFVPSDEYIASVHSQFPPLLSDAEQRFIGEFGEPTYVATSFECEEIGAS